MHRSPLAEMLTKDLVLTAGSFIVTVYGDVVVPRGEVLSMASLIELCARVGIRENLVRTAVSRLVSAGRLEGERVGRRSFYRLAPAARAEFARAAQLLYSPPVEAQGWLIAHAPGLAEEGLKSDGFARLSGDVWLAPDRGQTPAGVALLMKATVAEGAASLADCWDLAPIHSGYAELLARFDGLAPAAGVSASDALIARLLLVHLYRAVLLRDPRLPAAVLPADWPGHSAARLFPDLYRALTPAAEAALSAQLEGDDGPLPATTPQTAARLATLG